MANTLTLNTPDFPETSFSISGNYTARPGFTFDPNLFMEDFNTWEKGFLKQVDSLYDLDVYSSLKIGKGLSDVTQNTGDISNSLSGIKSQAQRQMLGGAMLKTAGAAGKLFSDLLVASSNWKNINRQKENTKLEADVQMKALDNQILYFKNQIADKFNNLMARNTVTLATKNLRVTAGNLLEQTKDVAYDATQDIRMAESNAELKKILLRSQKRQADVTARLMKSREMTTLLGDVANLGLMIGTKGGTFMTGKEATAALEATDFKAGDFGNLWNDIGNSLSYGWNAFTGLFDDGKLNQQEYDSIYGG